MIWRVEMKSYHILNNGSQFGPYPQDQIVLMITSKQIKRNDLCWTEGMANWTPIDSVIPLPPVLPPPAPFPQRPQDTEASGPWFLYIPISRLIFMSIITNGLYEYYWIYKNWKFLKNRDGLRIMPFWRGVFGILFVYGIMYKIKSDKQLNSFEAPQFSSGILSAGWIILSLIATGLGWSSDNYLNLFGMVLVAINFLFLLPAQSYINQVNDARTPRPSYTPWTTGHVVVLVFGLVINALLLIGMFAAK
jgi:hypothetical protein